MEKCIIILMLSVTSLLAQNFEPRQQLFKWGLTGDSIYISSDLEYFQQSKPILGWHWGASKNMNDALGNLCSSLYLSNKYYDEYRKVLCSDIFFF